MLLLLKKYFFQFDHLDGKLSNFGSYEVKAFSVGFRTTVIIIIEVKGIMIKLWSILKC